jgi:hypothetical protein
MIDIFLRPKFNKADKKIPQSHEVHKVILSFFVALAALRDK